MKGKLIKKLDKMEEYEPYNNPYQTAILEIRELIKECRKDFLSAKERSEKYNVGITPFLNFYRKWFGD